jgi:hypothetical protein
MIAKNIKGKSFKGCVSYVMHEGAELLEAEGVWTETKRDIIRSFAMQRSGRSEIKQPVGHIPLSFSPEDNRKMTNVFMLKLAKEYMKEMGIGNTQYIIVRHHNTANEHLHIVYNRIDNDLKLISVNHDYRRNIKACKKIKDRYGLTYGKGKEKVKRKKLNNPDKVKYQIHDAVKFVLPYCKNEKELQAVLQKAGVETEFKRRRTTGEIEGISFRYNDIAFKGSQIDRKYSYGNLKKEFEKNRILQEKQAEMERKSEIERQLRQAQEQKTQRIQEQKSAHEQTSPSLQQDKQEQVKQQQDVPTQPKPKQTPTVGGVKLTAEQVQTLRDGGYIFVENMQLKSGKIVSAYMFFDEKMKHSFYTLDKPDSFVKYGKYEMRLMDKMKIEAGFVTRATVKWYGIGTYAHPYLWKENKSDLDYKESWGDPRIEQKEKNKEDERTHQETKNMNRSKGRKM